MIEEVRALFARYCQTGILVDTNILLLYIVGLVNRQRIPKFKRTNQFIPEDYDLLVQILKSFRQVLTTPKYIDGS